jgi:serine/threonine protein kinase
VVTSTSLPKGLRLFDGAYEIEGVLGQGGFGITYLAKNPTSGAKVAIKELFPEHLVHRDSSGNLHPKAGMQQEFEGLKSRFSREALTLKTINHPSSTRFIANWEELGTAFIAMEFVDGETLEARIARGALLSEEEAQAVLIPILQLLTEVHNKGLLHRDIKPANIILTSEERIELIDFGSVMKFSANQRIKITSRLLTPAYAPLEQYGQEVMLTPSTDLYALAATIYAAMTGLAPVSALDRANGRALKPLKYFAPHVTTEFSSIIMKALELRMEDRFSSPTTLSDELHKRAIQINPQTYLSNQNNLSLTKTNTKASSLYESFIQKILAFIIAVPLLLILISVFLPILISVFSPKNNDPKNQNSVPILPPSTICKKLELEMEAIIHAKPPKFKNQEQKEAYAKEQDALFDGTYILWEVVNQCR